MSISDVENDKLFSSYDYFQRGILAEKLDRLGTATGTVLKQAPDPMYT